MFTTVYTTLVTSKLGNSVQATSSCLKVGNSILKKVHRATKCAVLEVPGSSYKERLEKLDLLTLYYRRLGYLILMYRIIGNHIGYGYWKLLPKEMVSIPSADSFEQRLDT